MYEKKFLLYTTKTTYNTHEKYRCNNITKKKIVCSVHIIYVVYSHNLYDIMTLTHTYISHTYIHITLSHIKYILN